MNTDAETFAKKVVANAFDQALEVVRLKQAINSNAFNDMLNTHPGLKSRKDISVEEIIAAAAAEHALAAFFSNLQLTGLAKLVLVLEDDTEIDLEEVLNAPAFSFFSKNGWLEKYADNGHLAKIWRIEE